MASFVARASRLRILKAAIQDVWAESGFAFSFSGKMAGGTPAPQGCLSAAMPGRLPHKAACQLSCRDACPTRSIGDDELLLAELTND
jgi:hypothetical protein